jgi:CRP-like cAMP-binding protein
VSEQHPLLKRARTGFVPWVARRAAFGESASPRDNLLLAALPPGDYARLLPALEPVALPKGLIVHGAGDPEKYLYFIGEGIVSKSHVMRDGASAEFAITGREGVIGIAAFLGGSSTPGQAVVLSPGHAYRLRMERLRREFDSGSALPDLLLRYTQALMAQTGQIAVCNRYHTAEQRLCRWILSCMDRLSSNDLAMTHERVAEAQGVRREGITTAAGRLQEAGLIRCRRGHWAVLDRAGLEARVCECYAAIKQEYDRLLPRHRHDEIVPTARPVPGVAAA